jgi:integration host factor subunit beta
LVIEISECLSEGQRLEIRNFGVFEVKVRDARMGRNPRTGEEVPISEKRVATFKPGKALKEWVQTGERGADEAPAEEPEPEPGSPPEGPGTTF